MIKKYNQTETSYLEVSGSKNTYDKKYYVSVQPKTTEGAFTSYQAFTGTGFSVYPKRWSDKKLQAYNETLEKYSDELAKAFSEEETKQKATFTTKVYCFTLYQDTPFYQLLSKVREEMKGI